MILTTHMVYILPISVGYINSNIENFIDGFKDVTTLEYIKYLSDISHEGRCFDIAVSNSIITLH